MTPDFPQALLQLYEKQLIDKGTVAKAVVKLRIDPLTMAQTFGYDDIGEFSQEFIKPVEITEDTSTVFEPWTFHHMAQAFDYRYREDMTHAEIATELDRTPKAVQSFFRRTFLQGNSVNRVIWDLLKEGHDVDEVRDVCGHPRWRVQFVKDLVKLHRYAHTMRELDEINYPLPIINFED